MKKRIILILIGLMTIFPCVFAQAETSGQVYLEPYIGGTVKPNTGINLGLSVGYIYDYGLGLEATFAYRDLSGYNLVQLGGCIKYECPYLYFGYPVIGLGAGVIIDIPNNAYVSATYDPTVDYRLGYAFRIVPYYFDMGIEYRGDAIFMLDQGKGTLWGTLVEHSIVATFRVYLTQ